MRICDDDLPRLPTKLTEALHSLARKSLYLAKRYRFDLPPISQLLTARAHISTAEDARKAHAALNYLNSTRTLELTMTWVYPT